MLYICGQPGTGKTSSLNEVLGDITSTVDVKTCSSVQIFKFNAMTYTDVTQFAIHLHKTVMEKLSKGKVSAITKSGYSDEAIAEKASSALSLHPMIHKILVIDEIDHFASKEQAFLALIRLILKSETNTSIIGIANSVDLPFKKKHSALAMRDKQLLFEPYDVEQIESIL